MAGNRWDETAVFKLLGKAFPSPAHLVIPQVRNGTGYSRKRARTADAIVASVWPSRGLWIGGVEIKVSVADYRREIADPEKSADIQRFCKYWWIAAPQGVVDPVTLPETWGLVEVGGVSAKIVKAAPALIPLPLDMPMLCSILRSATEATVPAAEVKALVDKAASRERDRSKEVSTQAHETLKRRVKAFEEASGVSLQEDWRFGPIGEAVRFVLDNNVSGMVNETRNIESKCRALADVLASAVKQFDQGGEHGEG